MWPARTATAVNPAEELVDVVDEDDRVVTTVTRGEMRRRRLLHRCTYVLLRNAAGEILVHRRTDTKDVFPGAYDVFSGGVCAAGESFDDCARREVAEEFGVVDADLGFLFLDASRRITSRRQNGGDSPLTDGSVAL
jgi:8-oxo-dGTP pyrophosphatase MutT (NUDIX family)